MGAWYVERLLVVDRSTQFNKWHIHHARDIVFVVVFSEKFERSFLYLFHFFVLALKYVELVLLLVSACRAFGVFPKKSLLPSRVQPFVHQFHNTYIVIIVEMFTCLANAFPINVVVICFGFVYPIVSPVVFRLEPLEMIRFHYCFLDVGMTPLPWYGRFSNGIPCSRSSFASRSADWFTFASMSSWSLGRLSSWWALIHRRLNWVGPCLRWCWMLE